jgi:hypothetical protein
MYSTSGVMAFPSIPDDGYTKANIPIWNPNAGLHSVSNYQKDLVTTLAESSVGQRGSPDYDYYGHAYGTRPNELEVLPKFKKADFAMAHIMANDSDDPERDQLTLLRELETAKTEAQRVVKRLENLIEAKPSRRKGRKVSGE